MIKYLDIIAILFILLTIIQNNTIKVRKFDLLKTDIRIVQLSDLHTKSFGEDNKRLIRKVKKLNPDVIVITGDLVDGKSLDFSYITNIVTKLEEVAPVLYIIGNNEMWSNHVEKIIETVELSGGTFLNNKYINIEGVKFFGHNPYYGRNVDRTIKNMLNQEGEVVFLTHQPEKIDDFLDYNFDVALSGHTHGGQIRVPFVGALIAPDQGKLPKYDKGLYELENCKLIVSSGLGNSIIPIRIFNTPEIVLIT